MKRLPLLLAVIFSITSAATALGGGNPVPLVQYRFEIHSLRLELDSIRARGSASESQRADIRHRLESLQGVRLADGRILQTDTPTLGAMLSGDPTSLRTVAQALDVLDSTLQGSTSSRPDLKRLRQLDEVLRDPRFNYRCNGFQCIQRRFGEIILTLLATLLGGPATLPPLLELIFVVAFFGLLALIASSVARGAMARVVSATTLEDSNERAQTSASAADRAAQIAMNGDYRTAFRFLFLALWLELQERGMLELRPGMTNREYLNVLRNTIEYPSAVQWRLSKLIDEFDRVWYGHGDLSPAGYERCRGLARSVLDASRRHAA